MVTLIQTDLTWEDKESNLVNLERKIESIRSQSHVIILPEMFSTGFSMNPSLLAETMDGPTVQWMRSIVKRRNSILTGSLIIEEGGRYYNRLIWMLPNGQLGTYDKRHCFSLANEQLHYTPGSKRLIASVNGWRINLCICYDLRFPVWTRQQISPEDPKPEYDVLVYVANWPDRRIGAWNTLLPSRAIENQSYVIGVNRVGVDGLGLEHSGCSQVIDPLGGVSSFIRDAEAVETVLLDRSLLEDVRSRFPFWRDADAFDIL
jgi:predicted amidohydrolase